MKRSSLKELALGLGPVDHDVNLTLTLLKIIIDYSRAESLLPVIFSLDPRGSQQGFPAPACKSS